MKERRTIKVTGHQYHQEALASLLDKVSPLWNISAQDALNKPYINAAKPIYKFKRRECTFGLQAEPTNPYDPAALKVFADGVFIGYMPRGHIEELKQLLVPGMSVWVEVYGGPCKYLVYDSKKDWRKTNDPKYYRFEEVRDYVKAVVIFEWDK